MKMEIDSNNHKSSPTHRPRLQFNFQVKTSEVASLFLAQMKISIATVDNGFHFSVLHICQTRITPFTYLGYSETKILWKVEQRVTTLVETVS